MNKTKRLFTLLLLVCGMATGAWAQSSDVLSGEFTINASGDKVHFSKGNLQYINGNWQFAEHQYEYFGTTQSDNHCDLFAFNNYQTPDGDFLWRILSKDEWGYLITERGVNNTLSEGALYSKATIGGVYKGVIVFPDNYTHPEGTGFSGSCNNGTANYTSTVSLEGWAKMEAAGCVFLPAAGYGYGYNDIHDVNSSCLYESSTRKDSNHRYTPGFYSGKSALDDNSLTSTLIPVRYVQLIINIQRDEDGYWLIGSVQDWKDFADFIKISPNINAKMTADIDLGDDQTMIGTSDAKYQGIFDGQGHTLTVAYTGIGSSSVGAPFTIINGATIKNLHVKGSLSSAGYHPTSIVSDSWGTSRLEKVWGEVDITGTRTGWVEASGLVGCMKAGNLTIEDCLFTGTVNGSGSYNGCFIGYIDSGSATITNSLSTGTFSYSGGSNGFRGTHTNCYVKQFPTSYPSGVTKPTDEELADGTTTTALNNGRSEVIWVQDVLTNQPQLAIFANKYTVPSSGIGTFSAKAKFAVPEGLTAHYCKTYNSAAGTISVAKIDGAVPANTGVILKGEPGETYTLTGTSDDAATVTDNALVAVTEETSIAQESDGYVNFGLSGGVFKKVNAKGGTVKANRAYLHILKSSLPTEAKSIALAWDGETTGIANLNVDANDNFDANAPMYNLAGQRVGKSYKGIVVVNGKKVLIK